MHASMIGLSTPISKDKPHVYVFAATENAGSMPTHPVKVKTRQKKMQTNVNGITY